MAGLYETLFGRVFYPIYETGLRRRPTLGYLADYQRDQWLAPEQIAALQWARLKQLIEHCHREVPYYRQQWRELGIVPDDIRTLDDYARLPVLTKADIRAHGDALQGDRWIDRRPDAFRLYARKLRSTHGGDVARLRLGRLAHGSTYAVFVGRRGGPPKPYQPAQGTPVQRDIRTPPPQQFRDDRSESVALRRCHRCL
jgi:hypothetical protein